jgi:hypothetical protein
MSAVKRTCPVGRVLLAGLVAAGFCCARPVMAQDDGYRVGEERRSAPTRSATRASHRLARIEYVSGKVTWRSDDSAKWGRAETNRALDEGAQLSVEHGGRAEVRFDDGTLLRLGSDSDITLQTVYVDDQGEYTRVRMTSGIATLQARTDRSVFEINTPFLSVKTIGPSRVRIGVGEDVEVAVSRGRASLEGDPGKTTLNSGDFVSLRSDDTTYAVRALPAPDSWERWNEDRDHRQAAESYPERRPSPPARSSVDIFFSLGFPIFTGDRRGSHRVYGRGEYHRRW